MIDRNPAIPSTAVSHGHQDPGDGDGALRAAEEILDGAPEPTMPFKEVMSVGGRGTLGVVLSLLMLDSIDGALFTIFAPEIQDSLGISSAAIVIVAALSGVMVAVGSLPLGLLGDRRPRTTIAGVCTFLWAAAAVFLGMVANFWQLVIARTLAGVGKATEGPIQASMLTDAYPPAGRGRVLGVHRSAQPMGIIVGPLVAVIFAVIVPDEHEPWRWAFVFLSVLGLAVGWAALRLREPVRGRFEREALLGGDKQPDLNAAPMSTRATFARLKEIRTFYYILIALGAFGLCVTTVPIYLNVILEEQLNQDAAARGIIASVCAVGGLAGAALSGAFSDRLFRRSPKAALYLAGGTLAALGIGFAIQAYSPNVTTYVVVGVLTQGMTFGGIVALSLIVAAVTPPQFRATAFAVVGMSLAVVGGLGGAVIASVAEQLWGNQAAVAVVSPAASLLAGLALLGGAGHLRRDIARATADLLDKRYEQGPA
jgi:MFS family permease